MCLKYSIKVITLVILYVVGELLAMQAGKLTNSRQLRKLSGRKSIGGRQSMSGGVRSSAMARGSFVAHIARKSRSEESEKNLGIGHFCPDQRSTDSHRVGHK